MSVTKFSHCFVRNLSDTVLVYTYNNYIYTMPNSFQYLCSDSTKITSSHQRVGRLYVGMAPTLP